MDSQAPRAVRRGRIAFASGVVGAALAIVGMQAWSATAAPGDDANYRPVNPCRLVDTRIGADNVGGRKAPLGPDETFTVQVTGTNGNCVDLPIGAAAVATNITVLNSTAPSFLSVFPADLTEPPAVSSLNYSAGSPPTPNKVDSKLSPDGKLKLYNAFGTADVIVDVVGVYVDSGLTEVKSRLAALEARDAELADDINDAIPSTLRREGSDTIIDSDWTYVVGTGTGHDRDGTAVVFASATAVEFEGGADVRCVIHNNTNTGGLTENNNMRWEAAGTTGSTDGEGDAGNLAGVETFRAVAGFAGNYTLFCQNLGTDTNSEIWDPQITVIFIPDR